jgi:hypothetical protein
MAIYAEQNSTPREPIEAGMHLARCYKMIFIGTVQETGTFNGKVETKTMIKVRIGWEFPELQKVFKEENGPQPLVIENEYTLSMGDKANLRKMMESWRGKPYTEEEANRVDITKMLGQACMINLTHKKAANGKIYENITTVVPVPKQMKCPPLINPKKELNYDEQWDQEYFDALPAFIKDKMKTSREYQAKFPVGGQTTNNTFIDDKGQPLDPNVTQLDDDDDLPF